MSVPKHYFLYAEDDRDDQDHFTDIVKRISPQYQTVICDHGHALLNFLNGLQSGDFLPCCVILDMNMPILDGKSTLIALKKHSVFNRLPVVMFTTSGAERDKSECRELGASDFVTKPVTEEEMERCIKTFASYCTVTLEQIQ